MKSTLKGSQNKLALPRDNDSEKRHYLRFAKALSLKRWGGGGQKAQHSMTLMSS